MEQSPEQRPCGAESPRSGAPHTCDLIYPHPNRKHLCRTCGVIW